MVAIPVPPQDPEALRARLLEESRVEVPVTSHGERLFVRVSVQGYNDETDVERLLAAPALRAGSAA
jgi:isopenicillin-N epimerase